MTLVDPIRPAFHENQTIRGELIARVLQTSPLLVEVLDARMDLVDRNMRPVPANRDDDDYVCSIMQIEAVDLGSKPALAGLTFNDIITGVILLQRDEAMPGAILAATQVLTAISKPFSRSAIFMTPREPSARTIRAGSWNTAASATTRSPSSMTAPFGIGMPSFVTSTASEWPIQSSQS